MTVRDDKAWQEQLTEFEADDLSKKFRDFLVFWMNASDKMLSEDERGEYDEVSTNPYILTDVVSKALELAEQTFGYLSVEWIAQMLLLFCEHWEHGEALYEGLSFIEKRLVQQATAVKIADLQVAASMDEEADSHSHTHSGG